MSYTELHKGYINEVDLLGLTIDEYCLQACESFKLDFKRIEDVFNAYAEYLSQQTPKQYLIHNKDYTRLFIAYDQEYKLDRYINELSEVKFIKKYDYEYLTAFYNGGTCIWEVLDEYVEKICNQIDKL